MIHQQLTSMMAATSAIFGRVSELKPPTAVGWTIMVVSVGSVIALISFCLYRVFSLPPIEDEHLKGPLEIDTRDTENAD